MEIITVTHHLLVYPFHYTITVFQYRINAGADFDDHVYPYLQTAGPDTQYVDTEFYGNSLLIQFYV